MTSKAVETVLSGILQNGPSMGEEYNEYFKHGVTHNSLVIGDTTAESDATVTQDEVIVNIQTLEPLKVSTLNELVRLRINGSDATAVINAKAWVQQDVTTFGFDHQYAVLFNSPAIGNAVKTETMSSSSARIRFPGNGDGFVPLVFIHELDYDKVVISEVGMDSTFFEMRGLDVIPASSLGLNSSKTILVFVFGRTVGNQVITVKTRDNQNLQVTQMNGWSTMPTISLDIELRFIGQKAVGSSDTITAISNVTFQKDIGGISAIVSDLRNSEVAMNAMLNEIDKQATVQKTINKMDVSQVAANILKGNFDSDVAASTLLLLLNLGDRLGIPVLGAFGKAFEELYFGIYRNGTDPLASPVDTTIPTRIVQDVNSIVANRSFDDSYTLSDLDADLGIIVTYLSEGHTTMTYVKMFGTEAFQTDKLSDLLFDSYGEFFAESQMRLGRYPIHVYLEITEVSIDRMNDNDDYRVIQVDAGINLLEGVTVGDLVAFPRNNGYITYLSSEVPDVIIKRNSSNLLFPIRAATAIYNFDTCLKIIQKLNSDATGYSLLENNCQDFVVLVWDCIVKGERAMLGDFKL